MKCPSCSNSVLTMSERSGVEIDYCTQCRGIWLDRGELDKILEKSSHQQLTLASNRPDKDERYRDDRYRYEHQQPHYKHKRRKSFFEELFD